MFPEDNELGNNGISAFLNRCLYGVDKSKSIFTLCKL